MIRMSFMKHNIVVGSGPDDEGLAIHIGAGRSRHSKATPQDDDDVEDMDVAEEK